MRRLHVTRAAVAAILAALCLASPLPTLHAAIVFNGDVDPADPDDWNSSTDGYVGITGNGDVTVDSDSDLYSDWGCIGYDTGSTGMVTVDGTGSTWTNSSDLHVGLYGDGTLNITNGGAVGNCDGCIGCVSTGVVTVDGAGSTWTNSLYLDVGDEGSGTLNITNGGAVTVGDTTNVARYAGSTGTIDFGAGGGTLTTKSLWAAPTNLTGTGTINTRGLVSDVDLVFDSTHGSSHAFMLDNQPGQNITVNLNLSDPGNVGDLGIGCQGNGSLNIRDGVVVNSDWGYIGYDTGSTGVATVDGTGSTWNNNYELYVGGFHGSFGGRGTLNITNGGTVSNSNGRIGDNTGSTGVVTVDGTGSTWTNSSYLDVGNQGNGTLNIINGGSVSNSFSSRIGSNTGSTGVVTVDGTGSTWDNNFYISVGNDGDGTLNITNGGAVSSSDGYIGRDTGSTGAATVDGTGSTWDNSWVLYVGDSGDGTLNITNGGAVSSSDGYIGRDTGSTGVVTVNGSGSTWTSYRLYVGDYGDGTLNITNGGVVGSGDGIIGYDTGSTGVVTVDGTGSTWTNYYDLYVGGFYYSFGGRGTLNITNGGGVSNEYGYIGDNTGSTGVVTVDGTGSTWTNSYCLSVGSSGDGTLNITNGGAVIGNDDGFIGDWSGSTGVATVDGTGSTWTNSSYLYVGYEGNGTLNITGGGAVRAMDVSVNSQSLLAIDVGNGSLLTVDGGSGTITNDGVVRVMAGAGATAGTPYSPISAGTWSGGGTYQALGGVWNATTHVFTVSEVEPGTSGTQVTIDLADKQRVLIGDSGTGWSLGVSFAAKGDPTPLDFTATAISGGILEELMESGQAVLGGWELEAAGYTDPAYLSFDVGAGFSRSDLNPWHYDGTTWTEFDAMDLTYDGQYASFTVRGFSGYAVAAVPEPGTLVSLLIGTITLALFARRRG